MLGSAAVSFGLAPLPSLGMPNVDSAQLTPGFNLATDGKVNFLSFSRKNARDVRFPGGDVATGAMAEVNFVPWLLAGGLAVGAALAVGKGGGNKRADQQSVRTVQPAPPPPSFQPLSPPRFQPLPPTRFQPNSGPKPIAPSPDATILKERNSPIQKRTRGEYETREYKNDYSLGLINASSRYADGGTGKGQILAVFDSGADVNHVDLKSRIAYKWSYVTGSQDVRDVNGHGTHVASQLVGEKNAMGDHGIAFDAKLAVFQGIPDAQGTSARSSDFRLTSAFADAQRRSVDIGAVAINHSWVLLDNDKNDKLIDEFESQGELRRYLGDEFINALRDSAKGNLITVFAAGNAGKANVGVAAGIPVFYTELQNHMLAVVWVDEHKQISTNSNRCGSAANFCLAAPGQRIYGAVSSEISNKPNGFGWQSGTSLAAPHVTGAIAVLASNFPELTGPEITRILRETATDLGEPGVDSVYGHGLLNLENAVAPQGALAIAMGNSMDAPSIDLADSRIAGDTATASAFKASLAGTQFMVADRYKRGYSVDFKDVVATSAGLSNTEMAGLKRFAAIAASQQSQAVPIYRSKSQLTISANGLDANDEMVWPDARAFGSTYGTLIDASHIGFTHHSGPASFSIDTAINGHSGSYTATTLTARLSGGHSLSFQTGRLSERGAILGTEVTGAFGINLYSDTEFARLGGKLKLSDSTSLAVSFASGTTSFDSQGILAKGDSIRSSAIALGISKAGFFTGRDSFSVGLSRPLSIDAGRMVVDTPVAIAASQNGVRSNIVYREREEVDVLPSVNLADLQIGYTMPAFGGGIGIGGVWRTGNRTNDKFGVSASYGVRF